MSSERDLLYLTHIAETIELVRSAGPSSREALEADPNLRDATLYRLQTLSESASLLSPALKDRHPEIPWAAISGFRNRLVHGYTEVRSERVWEVIAQYLAPLEEIVHEELPGVRHHLGEDPAAGPGNG